VLTCSAVVMTVNRVTTKLNSPKKQRTVVRRIYFQILQLIFAIHVTTGIHTIWYLVMYPLVWSREYSIAPFDFCSLAMVPGTVYILIL